MTRCVYSLGRRPKRVLLQVEGFSYDVPRRHWGVDQVPRRIVGNDLAGWLDVLGPHETDSGTTDDHGAFHLGVSADAKAKIDGLGLRGYEWIPVEYDGQGWFLMHVTREIDVLDLARSRASICNVPPNNGLLLGHSRYAFRPEALDEDFFVVKDEPMLGLYLGDEAAKKYNALELHGTCAIPVWHECQDFNAPPPEPPPVADDENPWRERTVPDLRERLAGEVAAGLTRLKLESLEGADPMAVASQIEKLIRLDKRKRGTVSEADADALGVLFCELLHRHAGWHWVELRHADAEEVGWIPGVVDAKRKFLCLPKVVIRDNLAKGRSAESGLTGLLTVAMEGFKEHHWYRHPPKGYLQLG